MTWLKRFQLFEFCDQSWLPDSIRQIGMDYLAAAIRLTRVYAPTANVLDRVLSKIPEKRIVVLGAGSGGGILDLVPSLPIQTQITLTDLFPIKNFQSDLSQVSYYPKPVDAAAVPPELRGVRVMYTAFHHLSPDVAKKVLADAVQANEPIAIFEATERSLKGLILSLFVPIAVLLLTPFIRPFRWSRIFLTYVLPLIPILALWDGFVSSLRTYSSAEMQAMIWDFQTYDWEISVLKGPRGENIPTLVGQPKD